MMPRVELHLHLDGSLSYNVVRRLYPPVTRRKEIIDRAPLVVEGESLIAIYAMYLLA